MPFDPNRLQVIGGLAFPHLSNTHPPFLSPEKRRYTATLVPSVDGIFEIDTVTSRVAPEQWGPDADYKHPLRYSERIRGGCWVMTATNPDVPVFRDEHGMPGSSGHIRPRSGSRDGPVVLR